MLLKELIINDLNLFSSKNSDNTHVASEETIRLMIHNYQRENRLINPIYILSNEVMDFLRKKSKEKKANHYQLIVESGSRSLRFQGDPGGIHYAAMDVLCEETGKVTVLFADHLRGKKYGFSYPDSSDFPVHFIVTGGSWHQTDTSSCPIFTLQHLLLTRHDSALHNRLINMHQSKHETPTKLRWFDLPPAYNVNTQGISTLESYYKHIQNKETKLSGMMASKRTIDAYLTETQFKEAMLKNITWCKSGKKYINTGIQNATVQMATDVSESIHLYTEQELIEICYRDRYPMVADLLHRAISGHPLFDFVFSNHALFNLFPLGHKPPENMQLYAILQNEHFLTSTALGLIDLNELAEKVFKVTGNVPLNKSNIKSITDNLPILELLIKDWKENKIPQQGLSTKIVDLLLLKNIDKLTTSPQSVAQHNISPTVENPKISSIQQGFFRPISISPSPFPDLDDLPKPNDKKTN